MKYLLISIVFLLSSCDSHCDKLSNYLDQVDLKIEEKHKIKHKFTAGAYDENEPRKIEAFFCKNKRISIDESRRLLIASYSDYYSELKEKKYLEHYMEGSPFTYKELSVNIRFIDEKGNSFYAPFVNRVFEDKGMIVFNFIDEKTGKVIKYEETLEEAYKTVEEEENLLKTS
jgi:hypothetical protein